MCLRKNTCLLYKELEVEQNGCPHYSPMAGNRWWPNFPSTTRLCRRVTQMVGFLQQPSSVEGQGRESISAEVCPPTLPSNTMVCHQIFTGPHTIYALECHTGNGIQEQANPAEYTDSAEGEFGPDLWDQTLPMAAAAGLQPIPYNIYFIECNDWLDGCLQAN